MYASRIFTWYPSESDCHSRTIGQGLPAHFALPPAPPWFQAHRHYRSKGRCPMALTNHPFLSRFRNHSPFLPSPIQQSGISSPKPWPCPRWRALLPRVESGPLARRVGRRGIASLRGCYSARSTVTDKNLETRLPYLSSSRFPISLLLLPHPQWHRLRVLLQNLLLQVLLHCTLDRQS